MRLHESHLSTGQDHQQPMASLSQLLPTPISHTRIGWPIALRTYPDIYFQKASWGLGASAFSLRRKRRWS